jgi:hypothetical protein
VDSLTLPAIPPVVWWVAGGLVVAVLALTFTRLAARAVRRRPAEDTLTIVAASIATGVSAQGMWNFAGDVLGFDGPIRVALFAFIEVAMVTSAVRARRSMKESAERAKTETWVTPSAGADGVAVWVFTVLTAVLSTLDASSPAEGVFRLAAPLVAAWLWERGMAVERRRITGLAGIHWRITPERILVRLGLAESRDRTASEVDAHRRLTRVALAAKRVRGLRAAGVSGRRMRSALAKLDRALERAVEHTGIAHDTDLQAALLDQVSTLYGGISLVDLSGRAPWSTLDHPALAGVQPNHAQTLAKALDAYTASRLRPGEPDPVAELVASHGRNHPGDRPATDLATGRDRGTVAGELPPPSPEGRSWLVQQSRPRPTTRPVATVNGDRPPVATNGAVATETEPVGDRPATTPATDPRPTTRPTRDRDTVAKDEPPATDPRPTGDRKRPTEQDKHRAIDFYIREVRKGRSPSKKTVAERFGFSETWALTAIREAREALTREGWSFDDRGTPTPPATYHDHAPGSVATDQ